MNHIQVPPLKAEQLAELEEPYQKQTHCGEENGLTAACTCENKI
jgi:hypothetical protein